METHRRRAANIWLWASLLCACIVLCSASSEKQYAAVIDAGSSGSRMHIYSYVTVPDKKYPDVDMPPSIKKITPGLSTYATDPSKAGDSITELVEFAKGTVPEKLISITPIFLLATAGLRMLPNVTADAIILSVAAVLSKSGFAFKEGQARVLPGNYEGFYAWLAINYVNGALEKAAEGDTRAAPLVNLIELGGASMQVSYMPLDRTLEAPYSSTISLPGIARSMYVRSFLGAGLDAARSQADLLLENGQDPCLPQGYKDGNRTGLGNPELCYKLALKVLPRQGCNSSVAYCQDKQTAKTPRLTGVFQGVENFYYLTQYLQLEEEAGIVEIEEAGAEFCGKTWEEVTRLANTNSWQMDYARRVCFSSMYIYALLADFFAMDEEDALELRLNNTVVEPDSGRTLEPQWVLGAVLVEAALGKTDVIKPASTAAATLPIAGFDNPWIYDDEYDDEELYNEGYEYGYDYEDYGDYLPVSVAAAKTGAPSTGSSVAVATTALPAPLVIRRGRGQRPVWRGEHFVAALMVLSLFGLLAMLVIWHRELLLMPVRAVEMAGKGEESSPRRRSGNGEDVEAGDSTRLLEDEVSVRGVRGVLHRVK